MSLELLELLSKALGETVLMVFVSATLGLVCGLPVGVLLYATKAGQFAARPALNWALSTAVNALRSVPFIILLVSIIPLTRWIVGSSIGTAAAIVPLALGATPFIARLVEGSLLELPSGLTEAARAMGAGPLQIVRKILLPEALPGLINVVTITLVTLVGYSAVAGAVGGGGLGDLGIRYGYQRFETRIMIAVVVLLIALVQLIQTLGAWAARAVDHR